jgi:hypothetical protein
MKRLRYMLLVMLFGFVTTQVSGLEVEIDSPQLDFNDNILNVSPIVEQALQDLEDTLNNGLQSEANAFASELEAQDLGQFSSQPKLVQGFANAGSTAAHLGTQRSFSDYRIFAVSVGTGLGASTPGLNEAAIGAAIADIETEGDLYVGAAVQPITVSLGVNTGRWVPGTRVDAKVGYADIPPGLIAEEIAFSAVSFGLGVSYQLVPTYNSPIGVIKWRGVTASSGLIIQRNTTDIEIDVAGEEGFTSDPITFADLGVNDQDLQDIPNQNVTAETELGYLDVHPVLHAGIDSRTVSIPLEASTGVRLLWLFELNVGAGVDMVFGSSQVSVGSSAMVDFVETQEAQELFGVSPGTASVTAGTTNGPQFLRPRLTAGFGLNLGPVKLDVPLMLYFDSEGNSVMAGVNVGVVW